ncbi:MAG TPA: DUF6665 family protein [Xanthobacteraceae bacterium]|nr:DUF6665 family protein [Xanthobacteraceae bacterium]
MTLRPPSRPAGDLWQKSPAAALDYEIAQETAAALGRQGRALEAALQALAAFDAGVPSAAPADDRAVRADLVAAAAQALWEFVVQREACGLRDGGMVVRMYRVPAEVRDRMGVFPPHTR